MGSKLRKLALGSNISVNRFGIVRDRIEPIWNLPVVDVALDAPGLVAACLLNVLSVVMIRCCRCCCASILDVLSGIIAYLKALEERVSASVA